LLDRLLAESRAVLKAIPASTINAVITSPPYALHFKTEYGNADKRDYVEWFLPFAARQPKFAGQTSRRHACGHTAQQEHERGRLLPSSRKDGSRQQRIVAVASPTTVGGKVALSTE
jgi:hypothetical protein